MGTHLLGKFAYAVLVGVFGTILIALFLATFLHLSEVLRLVPFIIALNTALAGYISVEKTRDQVRHKYLFSMGAGILAVFIAYAILAVMLSYWLGESFLGPLDLLIFLVIGVVCSELGAFLAVKYFKLNA
jgi:sterol desaturase/sphingolipid hydroxylase (fatty acid hydroxylase superfamily)